VLQVGHPPSVRVVLSPLLLELACQCLLQVCDCRLRCLAFQRQGGAPGSGLVAEVCILEQLLGARGYGGLLQLLASAGKRHLLRLQGCQLAPRCSGSGGGLPLSAAQRAKRVRGGKFQEAAARVKGPRSRKARAYRVQARQIQTSQHGSGARRRRRRRWWWHWRLLPWKGR
jgi:hypothetical protein